MTAQSILTRTPPPPDRQVSYGATALQVADIRVPEGTGPFPAVIGIHGGFWRNAYGREHFGHVCASLTKAGFVTWNLEYRRLGDAGGGWPGTFHDIVAGARFMVQHASELNVDPNRIAVIGHSAGGHLATWLASLANVDPASEIAAEPFPLRGAVSLAGVLDLVAASNLGLSSHATDELLGGSPTEVPERYAAASPLALIPGGCPVIAIHGHRDDTVPAAFSERYVAAARQAGGASRALILPQVGHFEVIDPKSAAWAGIQAEVRSLFAAEVTPATFPSPTPVPKRPARTGWT